MNNIYRNYWDAHAANVGAVKAVTGWGIHEYIEFYRGVLKPLVNREAITIADVGCGPALLVPLLKEMWPKCEYSGYDISLEMVNYATYNAPGCKIFLIEDELKLSSPVDLILCHSVFTHIFPQSAAHYLDIFKSALSVNGVINVSIHTETEQDYTGSIQRIDYRPDYFEGMVSDAGLIVDGYKDVQVPAGRARYYRLVK